MSWLPEVQVAPKGPLHPASKTHMMMMMIMMTTKNADDAYVTSSTTHLFKNQKKAYI